jgi:hypothetical protein
MSRAIPPPPQYTFMTLCLVKHRDNFTFTLHQNKLDNKVLRIKYGLEKGEIPEGLSKLHDDLHNV